MNKIFFIAATFILLTTTFASAQSCKGQKPGFYCLDKTKYAWCYGQDAPSIQSCSASLECLCGYTQGNPCGWPYSKPSDCDGAPGDYLGGGDKPTPEPTPPTPEPGPGPTPEPGPGPTPAPGDMKVVSYFDNWSQYHTATLDGRSCQFKPANVVASHLTHINYAFAVLTETFEVRTFEWNDEQMYGEMMMVKSKWPKVKILLSIGGWNFNLFDNTKWIFSEMASTAAGRSRFIKSAISFARKYKFDGLDIDWEYPGWEEQGGKPRDTENFTKLLQELRAAIDAEGVSPKLLLTIAAPAGEDKIKLIQIDKIHQPLDFINLMAYDLHGAWDPVTGPHTALYSDDGLCIDHAVNLYLKAGVPPQKLILGLATYGRTWTLVNTNDHKYGSPAKGAGSQQVCTQEAGFLASFEVDSLLKSGGQMAVDDASATAYAWKGTEFVTFDTFETHKVKTDWLCKKGLGGAMVWAMSMDTDFKYINKIYDNVMACSTGPAPEPKPEPEPGPSPGDKCSETDIKACDSKLMDCTGSLSLVTKICDCVSTWNGCLDNAGCKK